MRDFLAALGGFSLFLCITIVLLLPALLAILLSAQWLWAYIFYLGCFCCFMFIVLNAHEKGGK